MAYQRNMPIETRAKISASLKGHRVSNETKKRISAKIKELWNGVPKIENKIRE